MTAAERCFPPGFLWGSATSAHQVEGGNRGSDWWAWEHAPGSAIAAPSGDAIDHWGRYADDIALLASLGHNAIRLSIEWARLEPRPGFLDAVAFEHYRGVLTCAHAHGLTPLVTLHHFTLPVWLSRVGGWLAPDALERFRAFVAAALDRLGDLMSYVATLNEPQIVALYGYLIGVHPPHVRDPKAWRRVGRVLRAAHEAACDLAPPTIRTGLCHALPGIEPAHPSDVRSRRLSAELEREMVDLYLDDLAGDFVGVQYYSPWRVDPDEPDLLAPARPGVPVTEMGWEIDPDGLRRAVVRAARTGLPVIVTENGIATSDDTARVRYLHAHLAALERALRDGVPVLGYLHWSSFDNFEWQHGFTPRFGLVGIDREDGLRRVPRPSGHLLGQVAAAGDLGPLRAALGRS